MQVLPLCWQCRYYLVFERTEQDYKRDMGGQNWLIEARVNKF